MENQENFNRDFKGVWIPKEVWLDDRLNALDKIILTEIDSLDQGEDGCFASNEYIANFCQCSATKVSTSINQLIKYGYLYVLKFDGRKRHLKSRLSNFERQDLKNSKADIKKLKDINTSNKPPNNTSNNKKANKKKEFIPPTLEEVKAYCESRCNKIDPQYFYDYFTASDWVDSKGNKVKNWKQKIITWEGFNKEEKKNESSSRSNNTNGSKYNRFTQ